MKQYKSITQYENLFKNKKIKEIDNLCNNNERKNFSNSYRKLEENIKKCVSAFIPEEQQKLKSPIQQYNRIYTHYKKSDSYGLITIYNPDTNDDRQLYLDDIFENYNKLEDTLPEELKTVLTEFQKIYTNKIYIIHYTRKNIGQMNNYLFKFFSCPARTTKKSQLNLIIETTEDNTYFRIPALHYWNISTHYQEFCTNRNKLQLLKLIFYKQIKSELVKHNKEAKIKLIKQKRLIKEINKNLEQYFTLALI